jgi:hypothetical protein
MSSFRFTPALESKKAVSKAQNAARLYALRGFATPRTAFLGPTLRASVPRQANLGARRRPYVDTGKVCNDEWPVGARWRGGESNG